MILSTNAFNWAALRSGMGMGDFIASLSPEREAELFKAYNEWRKKRGLPEEVAPVAPAAAPAPSSAPKQRKESALADALSALITEVAAEVEEEEAEEAALIQNALDGADEIVDEETSPVPAEVEKEIEADEPEPIPEEIDEEADEPVREDEAIEAEEPDDAESMTTAAEGEPEVTTTLSAATVLAVDFATVIRLLPKEADPDLYNRIKAQFGEETLTLAQAALKEATAKHRGTAAIRALIAWLEQERR